MVRASNENVGDAVAKDSMEVYTTQLEKERRTDNTMDRRN